MVYIAGGVRVFQRETLDGGGEAWRSGYKRRDCGARGRSPFFFLFSLYSLRAVFIVGTSGTPLVLNNEKVSPVVSSTNCSRTIFF